MRNTVKLLIQLLCIIVVPVIDIQGGSDHPIVIFLFTILL